MKKNESEIRFHFDHERMDVYRLALEVNRWFGHVRFPAGRSHLLAQARRAIDSVVCNIGEGLSKRNGSGSNALVIALGEAGECCATLDCVTVRGGGEQQQKLRRVGAMLAKMTR